MKTEHQWKYRCPLTKLRPPLFPERQALGPTLAKTQERLCVAIIHGGLVTGTDYRALLKDTAKMDVSASQCGVGVNVETKTLGERRNPFISMNG